MEHLIGGNLRSGECGIIPIFGHLSDEKFGPRCRIGGVNGVTVGTVDAATQFTQSRQMVIGRQKVDTQ